MRMTHSEKAKQSNSNTNNRSNISGISNISSNKNTKPNPPTLGSLFDGAGGFPLAGHTAGIVPVWASEIEPFPIAVTTKNFPDMLHLGNITDIKGSEAPPVDIITFGSPCQDLSLAGKRAGLSAERSGLFMEAIRIIKEMRDATDEQYPRFIVWENVPGAFISNNGEDFRTVLEEIERIKAPDITTARPQNRGSPSRKSVSKGSASSTDGSHANPTNPTILNRSGEYEKWHKAGCILGDDYSIAWRVLDAQFWGVPQRRKRIYLVADFGGITAPKILFKP